MKYVVVYEQSPDGTWGASVPDLQGCFSMGDTLDDVRETVEDAMALRIEVEREAGHLIPTPTTVAESVEVA
ncbi:MAG TPA: type II toxin-antitoxin system HicB family antitoxin [Candidatus Baltobacteraceae bacterium]|nr:type II toxin-antitoxin system HicB family antitoxin [Candidatus Baltobacteraceae bacterium]